MIFLLPAEKQLFANDLEKLQAEAEGIKKSANIVINTKKRLEIILQCNQLINQIDIYKKLLLGPDADFLEEVREKLEKRFEVIDSLIKPPKKGKRSA